MEKGALFSPVQDGARPISAADSLVHELIQRPGKDVFVIQRSGSRIWLGLSRLGLKGAPLYSIAVDASLLFSFQPHFRKSQRFDLIF